MRTHYETLDIPRKADAAAIRTAYRKLALLHHPDRSTAPGAAAKFSALAEAYAVLSDPDRRREYDVALVFADERQARASARVQATAATAPMGSSKVRVSVASDLTRLAALFSRGKFLEAEALAQAVLESNPREGAPYAILGDIARARGEINYAANMYAHAVQMDPRNVLYQKRYEELLAKAAPGAAAARGGQGPVAALGTAFLVAGFGSCYMALANERPMLPKVGLIDTLTLGTVVMLFLIGVAIGAAFSVGGVIDRFSSVSFSASGRLSPTVALASVAVVSFWAAVALYATLAMAQRTTNVSVTRLVCATVGAVLLATLAALMSPVLNPFQVLLWGGNLAYVGAVCGWMTADALRR